MTNKENTSTRIHSSLLVLALVAMFVGIGSSVLAKGDWFVKSVVSSSRFEAGMRPIAYGTSSDKESLAIGFGKSLVKFGSFSLSLGSGYEDSQDIGFNSIPLTAEFRYTTHSRIRDITPFAFVESGVFYGYSAPTKFQRTERGAKKISALGSNYAIGLGGIKEIDSQWSFEFSLLARLQVIPGEFGLMPAYDGTNLLLPIGTTPVNYSLDSPSSLNSSLAFSFGLRF